MHGFPDIWQKCKQPPSLQPGLEKVMPQVAERANTLLHPLLD